MKIEVHPSNLGVLLCYLISEVLAPDAFYVLLWSPRPKSLQSIYYNNFVFNKLFFIDYILILVYYGKSSFFRFKILLTVE